MSTEQTHYPKLILFMGTEASDQYLPFLKLLDFCEPGLIPLFTMNHNLVFESLVKDENTSGKSELVLYNYQDMPDFYKTFEEYLTPGEGRLLIVAGYSFDDRKTNSIIAEEVEAGLRLLLLDTGIQYKRLSESLKISNIKHKVRIENMEFGNWDEHKLTLLSGILKDECQRAGI